MNGYYFEVILSPLDALHCDGCLLFLLDGWFGLPSICLFRLKKCALIDMDVQHLIIHSTSPSTIYMQYNVFLCISKHMKIFKENSKFSLIKNGII
jgi:hypothetical protein